MFIVPINAASSKWILKKCIVGRIEGDECNLLDGPVVNYKCGLDACDEVALYDVFNRVCR